MSIPTHTRTYTHTDAHTCMHTLSHTETHTKRGFSLEPQHLMFHSRMFLFWTQHTHTHTHTLTHKFSHTPYPPARQPMPMPKPMTTPMPTPMPTPTLTCFYPADAVASPGCAENSASPKKHFITCSSTVGTCIDISITHEPLRFILVFVDRKRLGLPVFHPPKLFFNPSFF